ncbi:hypothetical protein QQF64_034327 [Cirrhinus molitorella]|uniref:C-type lectin domain-containing protein n=1 Tax=Cirrhinus molitorella TaxID=172907 RepID=A0ABR3L1F2_9TELE
MELEDFYNNAKWINVKDTNGPQRHLKEEKAQSCRGRRCLVAIIVCLGVICLLLIAAIILQHFQATSKRGYLWGPDGLFIEEKQRLISPLIKERVWIGLSDRETKGNMKWVDNSPLKQVFWAEASLGSPFSAQSTEFEKGQNSHSIPDLSTRQPLPRELPRSNRLKPEVPPSLHGSGYAHLVKPPPRTAFWRNVAHQHRSDEPSLRL